MHLLSFAPRVRSTRKPPADIQHTVQALVDDIQVLALNNRAVVLEILAQFAHEERALLQDSDRHGDLSQN